MTTNIEDYITSKNNKSNINNLTTNLNCSFENYLNEFKELYTNLLNMLVNNKELILNNQDKNVAKNVANNTENKSVLLKKKFNNEYNKQIRLFANKINKLDNINIQLSKSILLNILNNLIKKSDLNEKFYNNEENYDYIELMKLLLRKKPMRSNSGILSITVITAPFPNGQTFSCKHNCYYCPNEPAHEGNNWQAQPRSYLYWEPAVQRANRWNFYAINQMLDRMDSYFNNGHIIDKLEIIVEGGTYTEYPIDYLEEYHRDLFYAANIYFDLRKLYSNYDNHSLGELNIENISKLRKPLSIREEIIINKTAQVHIIGICIETRPDAIDDEWLWRFRKWGVTRIQLGAQHVDNQILKKINRGHTIEQLLWAMNYLKDNCFKIDIHIMPDLPGSSPSIDKDMFDYVYTIVCPDQMKVYPCEVVPWTVIEKWYAQGKYVPYFENNPEDLIDVVKYSMTTCPNWVRLPRVIRDIPNSYVQCGNNISNLRDIINQRLDSENIVSNDIRFREIGRDYNAKYYNKEAYYNIYYNYANNGHDYFIAYESYDKKALFGFIRLRILEKNNMNIFEVLNDCGLIRELHVYGENIAVNSCYNNRKHAQHKGIGSGLLKIAEKITMQNGIYKIAVISGEGVKGYYEKNNYYEKDTFMIKNFNICKVLYYKYIDKLFNKLFNKLLNKIIDKTYILIDYAFVYSTFIIYLILVMIYNHFTAN